MILNAGQDSERVSCMYRRRINPFIIQKAREMRRDPTEAEAQMCEILKSQVMPKFPKHIFYRQTGQNNYILDFYCPTLQLGVEVDGGIHDDRQEYDKQRDTRLAWHIIKVHRFRNEDVLNDPQIVAEQLCQIIQNRERFFK